MKPSTVRAAIVLVTYAVGYAAAALTLPIWLAYAPLVVAAAVIAFDNA